MSEKTITHYYCDICQDEIDDNEGTYLADGRGDIQSVFSKNDDVIPVCKKCCDVILKAFGLIDIDKFTIHQFYLAAGYRIIKENDTRITYQYQDYTHSQFSLFKDKGVDI